MKIKNIKNVDKLFNVINKCKGKVELVTGNGDRLNLKSKLSQYVALAHVFSNGEVKEIEIIANEQEDKARLFDYMFYNAV